MQHKKIVIWALLSAAGFQQAFANNFYVGAGGGIASSNDEQIVTTQGSAPITHDLGDMSPIGSAFGGYKFDFKNDSSLGLEAFFTLSPKKIRIEDPPSATLPDRTADFSLKYAYGIRALPGYKILPDVLGYAILGLTIGSFDFQDRGAYSVTSTNFNLLGYQLGLGTSTALLKNLDARLDFIYTQYASHITNGTSTYGTLNGPMTYQDSPTSFSGTLSFVYKFAL